MATTEANTTLQANATSTIEPARPLANFPPSLWGDRFLSFSLDNSQVEAYGKAIERPKEQLRRLILNPVVDLNEKLSLVYSVYRLGLTYLFSKEIDDQLDKLFNQLNLEDYHEADLYTISIHFQVFRIFGNRFSCDVFNKFKNYTSGEFKEAITTDVRGLVSFYESAQLRIRGESILDEAFAFTETKLKTIEKTLKGTLARQVKHALERPLHRGHPMVEARLYLLHFEEEISRYDPLITLAKVHFNYLQLRQKEELQIVTKWWKELDLLVETSYGRDRIPELYVWILALFIGPYYSQARIITTKIIQLVLLLDDTYDAYATIEESRLITQAINRWDISSTSELPEYIRPFFVVLLNEFAELSKQLPQQNFIIQASKKAFQELARGYLQEAEWRHSREVPSFEEYMRVGLITSTHDLLSMSSFIGLGEIVTKEAFTWYQSHPKILIASESIARLHDDVMTIEFERERAPSATSIEAYMKTFGVSENVAFEAVKEVVENAWKNINEECLKPRKVSMDILAPIVNLARMIDVAYKYNDGFTFPETTFKEYITLLFFDPVPM